MAAEAEHSVNSDHENTRREHCFLHARPGQSRSAYANYLGHEDLTDGATGVAQTTRRNPFHRHWGRRRPTGPGNEFVHAAARRGTDYRRTDGETFSRELGLIRFQDLSDGIGIAIRRHCFRDLFILPGPLAMGVQPASHALVTPVASDQRSLQTNGSESQLVLLHE